MNSLNANLYGDLTFYNNDYEPITLIFKEVIHLSHPDYWSQVKGRRHELLLSKDGY